MISTYLVQRLNKPLSQALLESNAPLSKAHRVFGGGMMGLTTEMWDILDPIFTLHYMGAAEFEFGTVPRTIKVMLEEREHLVAFKMVIEAKDIKPHWNRECKHHQQRQQELKEAKRNKVKAPRTKKPEAPSDRTVYVLCRGKQKRAVDEVIRRLAKDDIRLKARSCFHSALDPLYDSDHETIGWFELDNGFFFFVDETAWKKTCELFEVKVENLS